MGDAAQKDIGPDKSLLLVDDDEPFLRRLAKGARLQRPARRPLRWSICGLRMATVLMWSR